MLTSKLFVAFALERSEEAFCKSIVAAVTGGAHALAQAEPSHKLAGLAGRGLAATVGGEDGVWTDQASGARALQSTSDDLGV
jgi:hypothetical protein